MKKITAYQLKSKKNEKSNEAEAIIYSKFRDIQNHFHVVLLEMDLLRWNQTADFNSQLIFDSLERVNKSLQSLREHISLAASVNGEERAGKFPKP
jgi:hypothetical protein